MEFKGLIVLLAVIFSATAAPTDSEEALLQVALDNEINQGERKADVAAAESTGEQLLNVVGTVLDLVKQYNQGGDSNPSTKSQNAAGNSFSKDDISGNRLRMLPIGSPISDTRQGSSTPKKPQCGRTDKPCSQRFLPEEVQDHYNTPIKSGDDVNAETEAIGALLAGAFKAFQAFKAIKSLIPKSGSNSGGSDSDSNSGSSPGSNFLDRIPNGAPSRYGNYARNFLGFPDDIGGRRGTRTDVPQIESEETKQEQEQASKESEQTEDAKIERYRKLRSFLGKALRVVNRKLQSRNRSPTEDRDAVNNPTGWKDLGRNLIGMIGDKLDPAGRNPSLETDQTARKQVTDQIQLLRRTLGFRRSDPSSEMEAEEQKSKISPKVRNRLLNMAQKLLERLKSKKNGGDKEATVEEDEAELEYLLNFDTGHHSLKTASENNIK